MMVMTRFFQQKWSLAPTFVYNNLLCFIQCEATNDGYVHDILVVASCHCRVGCWDLGWFQLQRAPCVVGRQEKVSFPFVYFKGITVLYDDIDLIVFSKK